MEARARNNLCYHTENDVSTKVRGSVINPRKNRSSPSQISSK